MSASIIVMRRQHGESVQILKHDDRDEYRVRYPYGSPRMGVRHATLTDAEVEAIGWLELFADEEDARPREDEGVGYDYEGRPIGG